MRGRDPGRRYRMESYSRSAVPHGRRRRHLRRPTPAVPRLGGVLQRQPPAATPKSHRDLRATHRAARALQVHRFGDGAREEGAPVLARRARKGTRQRRPRRLVFTFYRGPQGTGRSRASGTTAPGPGGGYARTCARRLRGGRRARFSSGGSRRPPGIAARGAVGCADGAAPSAFVEIDEPWA